MTCHAMYMKLNLLDPQSLDFCCEQELQSCQDLVALKQDTLRKEYFRISSPFLAYNFCS